MKAEGLDRLTEKQRECLRLVYAHKETKEIARLLGLSPDGVNQRIKTAMNTLGVGRRRDAAQIVAEAEGLGTYPPLVHAPRDIAAAPNSAMLGPSTEGERQSGSSVGVMREEQSAFMTTSIVQMPRLPLPLWDNRPSDLNWLRRVGWIIAIMLMVALVFGMFLAGLESLSRMSRGA
jgi:DNA-binding CsgD family transcriptional regulator